MRFAFSFNENYGRNEKCDPVSAMLVGTAATGTTAATAGLIGAGGAVTAGGLLSAAGTLFSVMGAAQAGKSEAAAAQYNAALARQEAAAEEARRRRESQRQLGAIRAGRAKSGATMEGTPLMVLAESAEMAELDALSARWTGETSARLDEQRAQSARKAVPYAIGSSLLTGVSRIGSRSIT